jgi:hypothetical protein
VYGRFDLSWNNLPGAVSNLKTWLDPLNLDPETLDGTYTGETVVDAELLAIIVPEEYYDQLDTIEPKVTVKNSGSAAITSATLSYTINGAEPVTKLWNGALGVGGTVDITFDAITLTPGTFVFEATVTVDDDVNLDNNTKTKNFIVDFPVLCEKPENLAVALDGGTPVVSWTVPTEIDGVLTAYKVYRNDAEIKEVTPDITEIRDEDELLPGTYSYQVEAIYEHCESDKTDPVSIDYVRIKGIATDTYQLFPNPATNEVTIANYELQITNVEIYDVAGKMQKAESIMQKAEGEMVINISNLSAGVYFVKIFTNNDQPITKQLVIAK